MEWMVYEWAGLGKKLAMASFNDELAAHRFKVMIRSERPESEKWDVFVEKVMVFPPAQ